MLQKRIWLSFRVNYKKNKKERRFFLIYRLSLSLNIFKKQTQYRIRIQMNVLNCYYNFILIISLNCILFLLFIL